MRVIFYLHVVVTLCIAAVLAAPILGKDDNEDKAKMDQVEADLKLMENAPNKEQVMMHKEMTHEANGVQHKITEHIEQVKDTISGETLAQKEQIEQTEQEAGKAPVSLTKIKVDVPSAGVHDEKTFKEEQKPEFHLNPWEVAAYLLETDDVEGVNYALDELVKQKLISEEKERQYRYDIEVDEQLLTAFEEEENMASSKQESEDELHAITTNNLLEALPIDQGASTSSKAMVKKRTGAEQENEKGDAEVMPATLPGTDEDTLKFSVDEQTLPSLSESQYISDISPSNVEKLRVLTFLTGGQSLDHLIYYTATEIFQQTIDNGIMSADGIMQAFAEFCQEEMASGRMSPKLEEEITEILVNALATVLGERPDLEKILAQEIIEMEVDKLQDGVLKQYKEFETNKAVDMEAGSSSHMPDKGHDTEEKFDKENETKGEK